MATHGLESNSDSAEPDESLGMRCFTENGLQHLGDIPEFSSCSAFRNKNAFGDISEDDADLCGIQMYTNLTIDEVAINFNGMGLPKVSDTFSNFILCYASATKFNFELNFEENRIDCTSARYDALRSSDHMEFYCTQSTQDLIPFCTRLSAADCEYYSHCGLNSETGVCKDKEVSDPLYATSTVRVVSHTTFTYETKRSFEENDAQALIDAVVSDAKSLLSADQGYVEVSAEVRFNRTSEDNDTFALVLEVYYTVNITAAGVGSEEAQNAVNKLGSSYISFILSKDEYTVNAVSFDSNSISMSKDRWNMEVTKKRSKMQLRLVASMVVIALVLIIVIIFEATILFNAVTGPSGYTVADAVVHNAMRAMENRAGAEESEDSDDSGGYSYSESDDEDESSESESSSYAESSSSYSS